MVRPSALGAVEFLLTRMALCTWVVVKGVSVVECEAFVDRADELSGGVVVGMWCRSGVLFHESGSNFAAV